MQIKQINDYKLKQSFNEGDSHRGGVEDNQNSKKIEIIVNALQELVDLGITVDKATKEAICEILGNVYDQAQPKMQEVGVNATTPDRQFHPRYSDTPQVLAVSRQVMVSLGDFNDGGGRGYQG